MRDASGVVGVQVGEDHPPHVVGREAEILDLRPDLLFGRNPFADSEPEIGVPAGEVALLGGAGRLAGVDDDEPLGVLDDPGEDGQGLGPALVTQGVDEAKRPAAGAFALARFDGDGAGLDGVDADGGASLSRGWLGNGADQDGGEVVREAVVEPPTRDQKAVEDDAAEKVQAQVVIDVVA